MLRTLRSGRPPILVAAVRLPPTSWKSRGDGLTRQFIDVRPVFTNKSTTNDALGQRVDRNLNVWLRMQMIGTEMPDAAAAVVVYHLRPGK